MIENLPIGDLICQELEVQERFITWLARQMDYPYNTLYKTLKRDHIDTALLWNISKVMEYDFFERYSAFLKDRSPGLSIRTPTADEIINKENLSIGELIQQELTIQGRSITWLAKKVYRTPNTLGNILKRDHIDTALLWDISRKLRYDFFAYYSEWLKN